MTRRRRRGVQHAIEDLRRRGFGVRVEETQIDGDVVDVRLDGSAPRVEADNVIELECPECRRRLQVVVSDAGPSDWRHEDPPCDRWLRACTHEDLEFRERVATIVRRQLRH